MPFKLDESYISTQYIDYEFDSCSDVLNHILEYFRIITNLLVHQWAALSCLKATPNTNVVNMLNYYFATQTLRLTSNN